jgi:hypothetical protein
MDPNHWPLFMWLAFALGLGSFVTLVILFVWRAFRRRGPGWILDCVLLGVCGFVVVSLMAAYVIWTNARLPKEIQRVSGPLLLMAIALALVGASNALKERAIRKKKLRSEK